MAEKKRQGEDMGHVCVALVGPQGSGKTTLLESILWITGAVTRKGSQSAEEHRGRCFARSSRPALMSVEVTAAATSLSRRPIHLHRLPRLDRIFARVAQMP